MASPHPLFEYSSDKVSFSSSQAVRMRLLYFPLCGTDSKSLKSSITPFLSGDIKTDKNNFLTKPVSREDLRGCARNFYVRLDDGKVLSLMDESPEVVGGVEAGPLWHQVTRVFPQSGIELKALNFVPVTGETVELMQVSVRNTSNNPVSFTATSYLPIFGRALVNKHDHEHVTALLQRIKQWPQGVMVSPTLFFNEEGHSVGGNFFYVFGFSDMNEMPEGSFPTVESFLGETGDLVSPQVVARNAMPPVLSRRHLEGKEALGALRFKSETLAPGKSKEYFLILGIEQSFSPSTPSKAPEGWLHFNSQEKFDEALERNKFFWQQKSQAINFETAQRDFDAWMKWVSIQPVLRRIFGNSFLPDHDYGKGGKGWRDLWQDLLSLILIEPQEIRKNLINNFAGIRIDGTNATIIGTLPGEFIADRNAITRVWMDHGLWPFLTISLYIDQTGDNDILLKEVSYFRDLQLSRSFEKDLSWIPPDGQMLKTKKSKIYTGTVLEHILSQHLVQFFNVGEHNLIRLESADWNDGLDMAFARGESAAFMSFYGGNLLAIADLLMALSKRKEFKKIKLAKEILILLDSLSSKPCSYNSSEEKKTLLFKKYFKAVQPHLSGRQAEVDIKDVAADLRKKGKWIFAKIRKQEKIKVVVDGKKFSWFNGYYDNEGKQVEGLKDDKVRMTLTGQVFAVMSGLAAEGDVKEIIESVEHFLKDKELGGYRLNTDFGVDHYLSLGRAFGFAFGTKENGAFFSHMNVMYAYALYKRGFVKEGREVLMSIYRMCMDTQKSKIYPGIPEYFDSLGRGMYHYLTGSASWLLLTQLTQVLGVRGQTGDLVLEPKLSLDEFDARGQASVECSFAGRRILVSYMNEKKLDYGAYAIKSITMDGQPLATRKLSNRALLIKKDVLSCAVSSSKIHLKVVLG